MTQQETESIIDNGSGLPRLYWGDVDAVDEGGASLRGDGTADARGDRQGTAGLVQDGGGDAGDDGRRLRPAAGERQGGGPSACLPLRAACGQLR
jgi:hypothetical protein